MSASAAISASQPGTYFEYSGHFCVKIGIISSAVGAICCVVDSENTIQKFIVLFESEYWSSESLENILYMSATGYQGTRGKR